MNRRNWLKATLASGTALCFPGCVDDDLARRYHAENNARFAALERRFNGRLGVGALISDRPEGPGILYRSEERFPMCSTAKLMIVLAVLGQSALKPALLSEQIAFTDVDLLSYSPVTKLHAGEPGMTVEALCEAAITQSDNTAANLLIRLLGGPEQVTAFARSLGDERFRLDRWEPELNSAVPGDERDTTTPAAMLSILGNLAGAGRSSDVFRIPRARIQLLFGWMVATSTGDRRIRAGVPPTYVVGDKTGTGAYGTTNDVGIIWKPGCYSRGRECHDPLVLVIFFTQFEESAPAKEAMITEVTRYVLETLQY